MCAGDSTAFPRNSTGTKPPPDRSSSPSASNSAGIVTSFRTLRRAWRIRQAVSLWSSTGFVVESESSGAAAGATSGTSAPFDASRAADARRQNRRPDATARQRHRGRRLNAGVDMNGLPRGATYPARWARSKIRTWRQRTEFEPAVLIGDRDCRRRRRARKRRRSRLARRGRP